MSYILNALRKSELERQSRESETLENSILETSDTKRNTTTIWLIILVIFNFFLLCYFIWSFSDYKVQEREVEIEKISRSEKQKVEIKDKVDLPQNVSIKAIEKPYQASIVDRVRKQQARVKPIVDKQEQPRLDAKKTRQQSVKKKRPTRDSFALTKPDSSPPVSHSKNEVYKEESNEPPFLSELDYEFRRTVPRIMINVLVHSKIESERFILISMTKYAVGDEIVEDMKLKEILMDSIVVDYKNKVFQIPR